ncbi:CHASE2 domain-containing protein [Achromobacter sp. GG226]|uniref:CHASE2 domain-containing protein n=1 Tax=Verticiella alkaliphila TaxID=2779529 RepID=UPI001C0E249A|nr:CHASE2 domain-containing protein [Verticiella sp. GG226]MBU4609424.1 CHASE2 domain-containing protein [Verticiella sp. GG226]
MKTLARASRRERGLLAFFALALAALLGWHNGLGRLDNAVYDAMAVLLAPAASPRVTIVEIDEPSLREHGRWPWDRRVLADLIERVSAYGPAVIGLDVLFPEPSADAQADAELAGALARSGRVALPMFTAARPEGGVRSMRPIDLLAANAAALGHVSIWPDEDGVIREVFLRADDASTTWNHLGVAMLQVAGDSLPHLPGERAPSGLASRSGIWQQDHALRIAFPQRQSPHRALSAAAVLRGDVTPEDFEDRLVLIGITAAGLGDTYPTPLTGERHYAPGVAILAAVVDNVAHGPHWRSATPAQTLLAICLAVFLLLGVLLRNTPAGALATTVVYVFAVIVSSLLLLGGAGVWVPPGAALVVGLVCYPVWSWRRLEAASTYMAAELRRLQREEAILPYPQDEPVQGGDLVDQRIGAMARATSHLRALNAFIGAAVEGLPDITLVADRHGRVVLGNQAAAAYFGRHAADRLRGAPLALLLASMRVRGGGGLVLASGHDLECRDAAGREFLLKYSECQGLPDFATIGIVSLIDVARLRQAERTRDEALRFLSHDLRAPLSAIQAIVAMSGTGGALGASREARIGRLAAQAQALAEDFVQLARAESAPMRQDELDYGDVVLDAVDACWGSAQARGVDVRFSPPAQAPGRGDADLLRRAVVNLITNAIKYGPPGGRVDVRLEREGDVWCIHVQDDGPGIAAADQSTLFDPFTRVSGNDAQGVGLGLAYVQAAVGRHGGRAVVHSVPGHGSTFTLVLPALS